MEAEDDGGGFGASMIGASNLHIGWAELLVASLARAGIRDVVVSPGSRSTPLVLAASKNPALHCHVVVDERSAAFFALGQARVSKKPSVLLCTSGTAAAHYFPAIIEASASFVPMLVLTADRPWEDRDTGASQTIDQVKMFAGYVRHFADVGPPDPRASSLRALARIATQSVDASLGPTPGPVHVNAQFRKPLEPVHVEGRESWEDARDDLLASPAPRMVRTNSSATPRVALEEIAQACANSRRGIIVAGPSPLLSDSDRNAIFDFARALGWPLLTEATGQLRFGRADGVVRIPSFDTIFRSAKLRAALAPDCIVELGSPPTSAGYAALLSELRDVPRFVIAPHGHPDPRGDARLIVKALPHVFAREIQPFLAETVTASSRGEWLERVLRAEAVVQGHVAAACEEDALTEASVARRALRALPDDSYLAIGNSNPVRDVDAFSEGVPRTIHVLHQRGAAGIDGLLSGAAGSASISERPTLLLAGDLTFLHDLGGCAIARKTTAPLVVLVVQNGGGRIFEELPLHASADAEAAFEPFFAATEDIDLAAAATTFGATFARPASCSELDRVLAQALERPGLTIVEARVSPHHGSAMRARFRDAATRALEKEMLS